ncbi:MAG TPA: hypothetical protein VGY99_32290 [Candidatus Binataceae bacterium]|nr:hypothetical protein [Candidatus Binataceae bacterium]
MFCSRPKTGTAIAGIDYTATIGSLVIRAGTTSTTIPVTVAGRVSNPPDKTFQVLLLGGGGAARSFTPRFAAQRTFPNLMRCTKSSDRYGLDAVGVVRTVLAQRRAV